MKSGKRLNMVNLISQNILGGLRRRAVPGVIAIALLLGFCSIAQAQATAPVELFYAYGEAPPYTLFVGADAACKDSYAKIVATNPTFCPEGTPSYVKPLPAATSGRWAAITFCVAQCTDNVTGGTGQGQINIFSSAWGCPPGNPQSGIGCGQLDPTLARGYCPWCAGNPINALLGNKVQTETDYVGTGAFPITFTRVYNSWGTGPSAPIGFYPEFFENSLTTGTQTWTGYTQLTDSSGNPVEYQQLLANTSSSPVDNNWRHNYDRTIELSVNANAKTIAAVYVNRGDSKRRSFHAPESAAPVPVATPGLVQLVADRGQLQTTLTPRLDSNNNWIGWTYVNENDETEIYDTAGKLLSITNRAGLTQTLQYDPNTNVLVSITDPFNRKLTLNYTAAGIALAGIVTPDGDQYSYGYSGGHLTSVTYPDGSTRQYVYEGLGLTGIIDENGSRFATWYYDNYGNAISSEHAGGVEKVSLTFPTASSSTVQDVSGALRTFGTSLFNQMPLATSLNEQCGQNCNRSSSMSYDPDGNLSSKTDYRGNVTTYGYNARDLETTRTEASGTAQARAINTQWHPLFRLPTQVTEPGRTTTFVYDTAGNLLSKTIAAGSSSRVWAYTYNGNGQILTVTGPRTDVSNVTQYGYDTSGNLIQITDAVGHVTSLGNYDANGRVGLITDPNGATTALTYSPRGWLTSKLVTAGTVVQSTSYTYDKAGQLTLVTLPDNSTLSYTYDPAHRLTNIQDSLGNSINYTLDLMSNRIGETVNDPNGVLTRQISRVFDAVNRLQQVTGAAQ